MIKSSFLIVFLSLLFTLILGISIHYGTIGYWRSHNSILICVFISMFLCGILYGIFYLFGILKNKIVQWIPFSIIFFYSIIIIVINNRLWDADLRENLTMTKGVIYECKPISESSDFEAKIYFNFDGHSYETSLTFPYRDDYNAGDSVIIFLSRIHPNVNKVQYKDKIPKNIDTTLLKNKL